MKRIILFILLSFFSLSFGHSKPKVIIKINEVAIKASPKWAELYCLDDGNGGKGVNISGFILTDLEGVDSPLATSPVTIRRGDYVVVYWDKEGIDETDITGDTNGNGYIDLYLPDPSPTTTDDQLVLIDGTTYIDAICWANQDGSFSRFEEADVNKLVTKNQWIIKGESITEAECVDSSGVTPTKSLARDLRSTDTNTKEDWSLLPKPTPGVKNPYFLPHGVILRINEVSFKEEDSRDWIELYCLDDGKGGAGVDIGGCYIKGASTLLKIIKPGTIIKTGEYLVLHQGTLLDEASSNTDGVINIFALDTSLPSTDSQAILYDQLDRILDAVCWANQDETWSNANAKRVKELSKAGEWKISGEEAEPYDCVDSTEVKVGYSIARDKDSTDTNTKNDWKIDKTPSMGRNNAKETPHTKISNLRLSNRCILTDGSDPDRRTTTLFFTLPVESRVTIQIYDINGRMVRRLIENQELLYGENSVTWDGRDDEGRVVPIGIYIFYLKAINTDSQSIDTKKITIVVAKKL